MAVHKLPFWSDGYLRIPEGQLLLYAGCVDEEADGSSAAALELAGLGGQAC
ncbi:hypothetical protein D3C74_499590 [compost metagenome]